nr:synaptotagmin-7-like [Leptinotarsa decemlineata]
MVRRNANKALHNVKGDHPSMAFLQNRSISLVDMYIDNSEPSENVGQIHFSLEYDFQNTTLILKIIQGKDLPNRKKILSLGRSANAYSNNDSPKTEAEKLCVAESLSIADFQEVDLSEKPAFWKALKPPAKDKCGELLTSLCYHPSNSILTLTLLKARNLKAKDINGKSDPYVKVWLQFGDKRIEKRKTAIFKCTLNPVFNDTFSFNVPWEKIRECSLDVMVMDFDNIGRNELIGRILLAGKNGSGASETKHWQDMITKPRQTIVQWHRLKPE